MRAIPLFLASFLALCAGSTGLLAMSAAEALSDAEQESQEEAQAGRRLGDACGPETQLQGRFYIPAEAAGESPDQLGVFVVKGRVYRLKATNERVRLEILKRKGQELHLEGAVRNRGTCFIVRRFAAAVPPAVALRDRKGL